MTLDLGNVDAGITLYIPFHTFDSNGASITITGLAVTDIEIYKNGSVTQRSSDAGYALLDTDGIDFDGITGIHGFSIDLNDNTDAGFYSAGAFYWVVVSAVTVDTRTINFVAATFRIGPAAANVTQLGGVVQSLTDLKDFADDGYDPATNKVEGVKLADTLTTYTGNTVQTGDVFPLASTEIADIKAKTDNLPSDPADQSLIIAATNALAALIGTPAGASVSADIAAIEAQTDDIGVAGAGLTALASAANLATVAGYLDTEIAAIITTLGTPSNLGSGATVAANLVDIEAQTDDIGAAGAGLTNINLPNQTMDIVGNITGNLSGSVGSVAGAVGSVTGLTPATIAAGWIAAVVEGAHTLGDYMRLFAGVLTGKSSGGGTATIIFRDVGDTKNRISETVDASGNRTAVGTRDGT